MKPQFKVLRSKLLELQKKDLVQYGYLCEEWRNFLPHTGKFDILLGSDKFESFMKVNPEYITMMLEDINFPYHTLKGY